MSPSKVRSIKRYDPRGEKLTIQVVARTMGLEGCACLLDVLNVACIVCGNIPGVSHKYVVGVTEAERIWCEILRILQTGDKG